MPVKFTPAVRGHSTTSSSRGRQPGRPSLGAPAEPRPTSSHGSASASLLRPPTAKDSTPSRSRSQELHRIPRSSSISGQQTRPTDRLDGLSKRSSQRSSVSPRIRSPDNARSSRPSRLSRKNSFDSDDDKSWTRHSSPSPGPNQYTLDGSSSHDRRRLVQQASPSHSPRVVPANLGHPSPPFKSGGAQLPSSAIPPLAQPTTTSHRPSTPAKYKPNSQTDENAPRKDKTSPTENKPSQDLPDSKADKTAARKPFFRTAGGFLAKVPRTFITLEGLKALNEHADTAKEWADWLNDLRGAPEEMQALSAKAATARDTVKQIQNTLETRPDLLEGESGQVLKGQIEDSIKSTNEVLGKMTKMLEDLSKNGAKDGTVLGGLQEFYNSYKYKSEWEDKVKGTDEDLQKELGTLSTLMINIYSRAMMKPSPTVEATPVPPPAPLNASTGGERSQAPRPVEEPRVNKGRKDPPAVKVEAPSHETLPRPKQEQEPSSSKRDSSSDPFAQSQTAEGKAAPPSPSAIASEEAILGTSPKPSGREQSPATANQGDTKAKGDKGKSHESIGNSLPPAIQDESPEDILLDAAWYGDVDAVAKALRNAPTSSCDMKGLTALHLASERDNLAVAMLLLDRGADANARANGGRMPLHLASRYASADTVELLLERGHADPDAQAADGRTALHYATGSAEDGNEERREVVRVLRDWGANPTLQDKKGRTPRDYAQKRDFWDVSSTLRRAEKRWDEDHHQNWLQRHGFMK